jgi:hypothetical protein
LISERLGPLRARLDALAQRAPSQVSALEVAWFRIAGGSAPPPLEAIAALDHDLDLAGVHTSADAQLLRRLASDTGRLGKLRAGLLERAETCLSAFETHLRWLERARAADRLPAGAVVRAGRELPKLARILKLSDCFSTEGPRPFELPTGGSLPPPKRYAQAKLAAAAFYRERARANPVDVIQKRRDLDCAHELLLRMGKQVDREDFHQLRVDVSTARDELRRAAPMRSLTETVEAVRRESRTHPKRAFELVRALYGRAVEANDTALAEAAQKAMAPAIRELGEARQSGDGQAPALSQAPEAEARTSDDKLLGLAYELDQGHRALFELSLGCGRYFDVEETLTEEIFVRETRKVRRGPRRVPYPTQRLALELTNSFDDLASFVISDPRSVVYDVASGRQLVRTYLEEEPPEQPKRVTRTAVRVYVCDGSGSMQGTRARFRDAIILAELANLRRKALAGEPFDPLYFSYFNDTPKELSRVDDARAAGRQIRRVFEESPAEGQTDITLALMSAFDSIRSARGQDPYLARATVVLVTDGEDRVDLELLRKERAPVGDLHIALSFISLGEENPDLRALIEEERAAGVRAFYHHLTDAEIASAPTDFDTGFRTLIPKDVTPSPEALEALLANLDQLDAIAQGQALTAAARAEVSFDGYFPKLSSDGNDPKPVHDEETARIVDVLDAVAEAGALALMDQRATECVALLEHLLQLYGISVAHYRTLLAQGDPKVVGALDRIRLLARPYG